MRDRVRTQPRLRKLCRFLLDLDSAKVAGYATTDFTDPNAKLAGDATGAGASVTAEQMLCFRCIIRT